MYKDCTKARQIKDGRVMLNVISVYGASSLSDALFRLAIDRLEAVLAHGEAFGMKFGVDDAPTVCYNPCFMRKVLKTLILRDL